MTSLAKKKKSIENSIEPEYVGCDIDELIKEKRVQIDKLKELLGKDLPEPTPSVFPYYDDLFFLRYILSFETPEDSVDPIKASVEYRHHSPKYADMLKKVENQTWEDEPIVSTSLKYQVAGLSDAKIDHGPLVIIRPGKSNSSLQFNALTFEEMKLLHFAYREIAFRECDKYTRSSRKIVKQLLIMDLTDVSISEMSDRRGEKVFVPVAKASANYYPQMQHKFIMVNAPGWISAIFGLLKSFMPARNFNKMGLCKSKVKTSDGDISKCPFASKFLNTSLLPAFLGGDLPEKELHFSLTGEKLCAAARKDGKINEEQSNNTDTFEKIVVSRRSKQTIEYFVPSKNIEIHWKILLAGYGIKMSALLLEQSDPFRDGSNSKKKPTTGEEKVLQTFREASNDGEKLKAENGLVKGVWISNSSGILRVTFDNSYSRLRSKTINYSIKFKEVTDDVEQKEQEVKHNDNIKNGV
jgi:hypothetical protein